MRKIVPVNEKGRLIGECHQNSKLTDSQVDEIRDCREDQGLTYSQLAIMFSTTKWNIRGHMHLPKTSSNTGEMEDNKKIGVGF